MYNKKQRGQERKLKRLINDIDKFVPFRDTDCAFEHFHVPSTPWIECPKTAGRIKTAFCKKWLETTEKFMLQKPENLPFCKITAVISYPNIWDSQIIIFYSKEYYDTFWDRKGEYQTWTPLNNETPSFAKTRGIATNLPETGYLEEYYGGDNRQVSYLWYYGEQL